MPVTPASLVRHELVGLEVSVTAASNPDLLDIGGEVVLETTKTVGVQADSGAESAADDGDGSDRVSHVPKEGTTFTFTLPSGERVDVEGRRLVGRPARRTENTGAHTWR
jgi:ribonuclease P protein subunit POP4